MSIFVEKVDVTVSYDSKDGFSFDYSGCHNGSKVIDRPCNIEYILHDKTAFGLSFAGVAFSDPFNNVITEATISEDGLSIVLEDPFDSKDGSVSFEFGFNIKKMPNGSDAKNLLLLSADPQVINKDTTEPAPGHHG